MEQKDIKTVQTTKGELRYYRDWDRYEGGVVMLNAQTVKRYRQIKDTHPDPANYNCFFAFGDRQFGEKITALRQKLGNPELKVCIGGGGLYGTKEGLEGFLDFYDKNLARIPKECDPQEVYFYEYNNHECMFSWDGDKDAMAVIRRYWGDDIAEKITRL